MKIPHGIPAKDFIDWVNINIPQSLVESGEAKRCRILLAEILLRLEKMNHPLIIVKSKNNE